jgi:hypothetical protein
VQFCVAFFKSREKKPTQKKEKTAFQGPGLLQLYSKCIVPRLLGLLCAIKS